MKARIFYYLVNAIKYVYISGDINHLYHKVIHEVDLSILVTLSLIFIMLELFVTMPNVLPTIEMKFRRRILLSIHLLLTTHSLGIMIIEFKSGYNLSLFIIASILLYTVFHKIHKEIENEHIEKMRKNNQEE